MAQDVLNDDEEVLQRQVIGVQHATISERLFQQFLDHQLAYVDQITALYFRRVPSCKCRRSNTNTSVIRPGLFERSASAGFCFKTSTDNSEL